MQPFRKPPPPLFSPNARRDNGVFLIQPIQPLGTATNKAGTPSYSQVLLSFPASILQAWGSAGAVRVAEMNRGEVGTGPWTGPQAPLIYCLLQ